MRSRLVSWSLVSAALLACSLFLVAQNSPTASGKAPADAAAAHWQAPKTAWGEPDFSGMWEPHMPRATRPWAGWGIAPHEQVVPLMTAWAKQQYDSNKPSWGPHAVEDSTDMVNPTTGKEIGCFPTGVPRIWVHPFPTKIVQVPGIVYMLYEFNHFVREIYTNKGREHAKDLDPSWMGDSVGWWDGDALMIDSVSFNDKTWVDRAGLPHSDQLHVVERITRPAHDKLRVDITIDDPKAYTKTWHGFRELELEPDWHLTEMICEDNITFNNLKNQGKEQ